MTRNPNRGYDAYDRGRRRNIYNGNPEPDHYDNRRRPNNDYDRDDRGQDEYDEYLSPVGNRNADYRGWYEDADYNNTYYGGDCGNNYGNNHRDLSADEYADERRFVGGRTEGEYDQDRRYTSYEADSTGGLHPGRQRTRYWDEEQGYRTPVTGNRGRSSGHYSNAPGNDERRNSSRRNENNDGYDEYDWGTERTSYGRGDQERYRQYDSPFDDRNGTYYSDRRNDRDFPDQRRNVADRSRRNDDFDRDRRGNSRRNAFGSFRDDRNRNQNDRDDSRRNERRR